MPLSRWISPWWMREPDPEVTSPEDRQKMLKRYADRAAEATKLSRFMEVTREDNHLKDRLMASFAEEKRWR